ncbi:MAG: hypothetical protein R2764_23970 [Bacteroidales bacterium]
MNAYPVQQSLTVTKKELGAKALLHLGCETGDGFVNFFGEAVNCFGWIDS